MAVKCEWIPPAVIKPKTLYSRAACVYIEKVGFDHVNSGLCQSPKCVRSKYLLDKGYVKKLPGSSKLVPNSSLF